MIPENLTRPVIINNVVLQSEIFKLFNANDRRNNNITGIWHRIRAGIHGLWFRH
jgi:hypothetical protein